MRSVALVPVMVIALSAAATPRLQPSFIADDYARARAQAASSKLPLFVEVWAPW